MYGSSITNTFQSFKEREIKKVDGGEKRREKEEAFYTSVMQSRNFKEPS